MKLKKLSSFIFIAISFMTLSSCDISSNNNKETITDTTSDVISTNTEDITPSKDEEPIPTTGKETEETKTTYADEDVIVTFEADNDTIIEPITVKAGTIITPPSVSKDDKEYTYTLDGWYTRAKNGVKFDFTKPIVKDITLFAIWNKTPKTYTVRFFDGTNGNQINSQVVEGGKLATEPQLADKSGLKFDGWYISSNMKTPFSFDTPIVESLDIYAKYVNDSGYNSNLNITAYNGYTEGAFVEFEKISGITDYTVSYRALSDSNFTQINSNLIRIGNSSVRADIVGIEEGDYIIRVEANAQTVDKKVSVAAEDRSGYAHFNTDNGVGAYNNDGTLKQNAVIVYVTDETKNTVSATINGKTYTGLVNILKNAKSVPVDVRILDDIKTCQFNKITYTSAAMTQALIDEQASSLGGNYKGYKAADIITNKWNSYSNDIAKGIEELKGLDSSMSYSSGAAHATYRDGKFAFDTAWNMCNLSSVSNLTIEGIGEEAGIFQWGFSFSSCTNIEVKNLRFHDYTEDAIGIEGGSRFWLHNNTYDIGVNNWDLSDEKDKSDGDGATDFKNASNLTISYCRYNNTHKSNLIGGSDSNKQWNITLHHNYYNQCSSRLPLLRQANAHIYNNYYYGCSVCQDIRANAFVLSENNYFENCGNPQKITTNTTYTGTIIKSYNDTYIKSGTPQATKVDTRDQQLDGGNCNGGAYNNFDTNTDNKIFYYDSTNKKSDVLILNETSDVKEFVINHAGAGLLNGLKYNEDSTTYTVKFETNGGSSINDQIVQSGKKIASVSTTKTNYIFTGWYTDINLTKEFNTNTKITSDLTLYAKWTEEITISFETNGGESVDSIKIAKGSSIATLPNTSKENYKFVGWYLDAEFKTACTNQTVFNSSQKLYAKFEEKGNEIIYTLEGFQTGDIKANTTVGNLTINIKDGKDVKISNVNVTIDGIIVTKNLKLGGAGTYSELSLNFNVDATSNITVYYAASDDRFVNLIDSNEKKVSATTKTTGENNIVSYTFTNVEAGSYSIASNNSSMFIYAIVIE